MGQEKQIHNITKNRIAVKELFEVAWLDFMRRKGVKIEEKIKLYNRVDKEGYLIFLIMIKDHSIVQEIMRVQERLAKFPCANIVLADRLHITIREVGYLSRRKETQNNITWDLVPDIISRASRIFTDTESFTVGIGRINSFPNAIFLEVEDNGELFGLHKRLRKALPTITFSKKEKCIFLPHISVTTFKSNRKFHELKEAIADMKRMKKSMRKLKVEIVELVKIDDRRWPSFQVVEQFRLGEV